MAAAASCMFMKGYRGSTSPLAKGQLAQDRGISTVPRVGRPGSRALILGSAQGAVR